MWCVSTPGPQSPHSHLPPSFPPTTPLTLPPSVSLASGCLSLTSHQLRVELCPPNSSVEVLAPSSSECALR